MKSAILLTLPFALISQVHAQKTIIKFEGLKDLKEKYYTVDIEGRKFHPAAAKQSTISGDRVFEINYLATGREHDLMVYASVANPASSNRQAQPVFNSSFQLKEDHELIIVVGKNGKVALSEKRVNSEAQAELSNDGMNRPISMEQFNSLYSVMKNQTNTEDRSTILTNVLQSPGKYFTVFQINNLLSLISSESERLVLAKKCSSHLLEEANAEALLEVFSSPTSKQELAKHLRIRE